MTLAVFHFPRPLRAAAERAATIACPTDIHELGLTAATVDASETLMRSFSPLVRGAFTAGLAAFEVAALARFGHRFSRLAPEAAHTWWASWWHSPLAPIRQFAYALKALLAFGYYEQPAVKERLKFRPVNYMAEAARRRLESYGADIRRAEAELLAPDPLIKRLTRKVRRHA